MSTVSFLSKPLRLKCTIGAIAANIEQPIANAYADAIVNSLFKQVQIIPLKIFHILNYHKTFMRLSGVIYGILSRDTRFIFWCFLLLHSLLMKFSISLRVNASQLIDSLDLLDLLLMSCLVSCRVLSLRQVFFFSVRSSEMMNLFSSFSSLMVVLISMREQGSGSLLQWAPFISIFSPLKSVVKLPCPMISDCLWRTLLFSCFSAWTKYFSSSNIRCFFSRMPSISASYSCQLVSGWHFSPPVCACSTQWVRFFEYLWEMWAVLSWVFALRRGAALVVRRGRWWSLPLFNGDCCCYSARPWGRQIGWKLTSSIMRWVHSTGNCLLTCRDFCVMASVWMRWRQVSLARLRMKREICLEMARETSLLGLCIMEEDYWLICRLFHSQDIPTIEPQTLRKQSPMQKMRVRMTD